MERRSKQTAVTGSEPEKPPHLRALIASDEPVTRRELETALLDAGVEVLSVEDGGQALEALRDLQSMDFLFLDELMSGQRGTDLAERLRSDERWRQSVMVLLATDQDSGVLRRALSLGVDDCLYKPLSPDELRLRLKVWKKLRELSSMVTSIASHDQVTGLYSHGLILETAQHELDRAAREQTPLSILMTDIDHLRQINDQYGHQMGDKVLAEIAKRMKVALRSYDLTGRYGGEEFLTVLPRCGRANAIEVGERIRKAVAAEPFRIDRIRLDVTVSIGVATTMGDERVPARRIIRAADHALYKAKREGRNRVELAVSLKTWAGQSN